MSTQSLPLPLLVDDARARSSGDEVVAQLPDEVLIERVARQDRDAFTALYRRYERPVFAVLLRLGATMPRVRPSAS